jgi:hypothetical protein
MRPLAPDATRLELASLKRKHDEAAFLHDMGAEAANVQLVSHSDAAPVKALRKDADKRTGDWLHAAATKMAELTRSDHKEWAEHHKDPSGKVRDAGGKVPDAGGKVRGRRAS